MTPWFVVLCFLYALGLCWGIAFYGWQDVHPTNDDRYGKRYHGPGWGDD